MSEEELREFMHLVEARSTITLMKSSKDGDPIHHEKMFEWFKEKVKSYTAQAVKDAQLELLGRLEERTFDVEYYAKAGVAKTKAVSLAIITAERKRLSDSKESE